MTVANTVRSVRATGNGTSTSFSTSPFGFFEVNVYVDGVLIDPSAYTITQATPGAEGTITFNTAPAASTEVLIVSDTELVQTVDYVDNDAFPAETHERQMDRLTMAIMDNLASVKQTIRAPAWSDEIAPLDFLNNPETVVWSDANGVPGLIAVDATGSPWVTAIAAAAAPAAVTAAATAVAAVGYHVSLIDYIPQAQHAAILARTSTYDATADVQACLDAAALVRATVLWPAGRVRCLSDVLVPVGTNTVDIQGAGYNYASELEFNGTGAPNGLHYNGTTYSKVGSLRNMTIIGTGGATQGITLEDLSQPYFERVLVWGFVGHGIFIQDVIMPTFVSGLIHNNGTASKAQMRVRSSLSSGKTTTCLSVYGLYIGGGRSGCVAGVDLDVVSGGFWSGGAIESSGVLIRVDKTPVAGSYTSGFKFAGVDLENPSTHFIEVGYGAASISDGPRNIEFDSCPCYLSGSTTAVHVAKVKNSISVSFRNMNTSTYTGIGVSDYELEGTNQGIQVGVERAAYGRSYPYVRDGGVMVPWATPLMEFNSDYPQLVPPAIGGSPKNISGATPNGSWQSAQGGIPSFIAVNNAGVTSMTKLLGCSVPWIEITLNSQGAGATTIVHEAGTVTDAFKTLTGSNLLMTSNRDYRFRYLSGHNMWFQVA
jgi:hypothetical protein